jgi:hypothetical protein
MTGTGTPGTINGEASLTFDGATLLLRSGARLTGEESGAATRLTWDGATTFVAGGDRQNFTYVFDQGISAVTDWNTISGANWTSLRVNGDILSQAIAAATISAGQLVYLTIAGEWNLADADSSDTSNRLLGIALTSVSSGGRLGVLLRGTVSTTYHDQLATPATPGLPLYVSTTAGSVTQTQPNSTGDVVRLVGHNLASVTSGRATAVTIFFQPDNTWNQIE